jgi:hypothetical protein
MDLTCSKKRGSNAPLCGIHEVRLVLCDDLLNAHAPLSLVYRIRKTERTEIGEYIRRPKAHNSQKPRETGRMMALLFA